MSFDPDFEQKLLFDGLSAIFKSRAEPGQLAIPEQYEPELKWRFPLTELHRFRRVYDTLAASSNVTILPVTHPRANILLSLGEDTVDADGHPTRKIARAGFVRRRRLDLNTRNPERPYSKIDESVKDDSLHAPRARSGLRLRREWENTVCNATESFDVRTHKKVMEDGYAAFQTMDKVPSTFSSIRPEELRLLVPLMAVRMSYPILYHLTDLGVVAQGEICNDILCVTTQSCEVRVAECAEVECEIKAFYSMDAKSGKEASEDLVATALQSMGAVVGTSGIATAHSEYSKLEYAAEALGRYYETYGFIERGALTGQDYALLQNVTSQRFLESPKALFRMAERLPRSVWLVPGNEASLRKWARDHDIPQIPHLKVA